MRFSDCFYPIELEIRGSTGRARSPSYLVIHIEVESEGKLIRQQLHKVYISLSWSNIPELVNSKVISFHLIKGCCSQLSYCLSLSCVWCSQCSHCLWVIHFWLPFDSRRFPFLVLPLVLDFICPWVVYSWLSLLFSLTFISDIWLLRHFIVPLFYCCDTHLLWHCYIPTFRCSYFPLYMSRHYFRVYIQHMFSAFDNRIMRYWLTFRFVVLMILINKFSSIINLRGLMRNMKPKKIGIQQKDNWILSNFWKNRRKTDHSVTLEMLS